jgi:hypothetical protein
MGVIRKFISGTAAAITGGASLGVIQFRSDTERGTRQTKLLRQDLERQHAELLRQQELQAQAEQNEVVALHVVQSQRQVKPVETMSSTSVSSQSQISNDLENLQRLVNLRDAGVLTEDEFEREKSAILKRL